MFNEITYQRFDSRANVRKTVTITRRRPAWYADLYELWQRGLNDGQIARELGKQEQTVWKARAQMLGLPANTTPGGGRRADVRTLIERLWAEVGDEMRSETGIRTQTIT